MHLSRIRGLLIQQGLEVKNPSREEFLKELESLRTWDGKTLPVNLGPRQKINKQLLFKTENVNEPILQT